MNKHIAEHYRALYVAHGDTAKAAQYADAASQHRRFDILTQVANLQGASVLDFGCGTGELASFLVKQGTQVNYTGVDLVPELLHAAKQKHPNACFSEPSAVTEQTFDYVFVSGVFNNKRPDNRAFYQDTLKELFAQCRKGLAFNMMSSMVDYYDESLFYESPSQAFEFVKNQLTPYVSLRNDYWVKANSVPFEFAIYAYKQPYFNEAV